MKMPNFRLFDTQATFSMLAGLAGLIGVLGLMVVVFKGLDTKQWVIPYNEIAGLSQYRKPVVFAMAPVTIVLGICAGVLGFRSLGQARNTRQGRSWLGMTIGAIVVAVAPVLMTAWIQLSEPVIVSKKTDAAKSAAEAP